MKFFLDTANLNEIREAAAFGFADGVTTNPSLIAKEGNVDFKQHIAAICEIVKGPVSADVTSQDADGMIREGREYSKIAPNVVIKCPLTREGLKATRHLSDENIHVNVTLCFSPAQAILARDLRGNRSFNNLADRSDVLFEVDVTFFCDQRRVCSHAISEAESRDR